MCDEHGDGRAPGRVRRPSSPPAQWEVRCPHCGRPLAPIGTRETKPLIPTSVYAVTKRDHEELCLVVGRRLRHPDRRAPLLQRLRPGPGALEPVHRCRGDLRLAPAQRPRSRSMFEDGAADRATSSTSSDIVRGIVLALESEDAVGHAVNLGTGRPTSVDEIAEPARGRPRRRDRAGAARPVPRGGHPALLRRSRRSPRSCSASARRSTLEDGIAILAGWLADQAAVDRVDEATRRARRPRARTVGQTRARSRDHRRLDERGALADAVPRRRSSSTPARITLDVVVADNESTDGTRELVEQRVPAVRVVTCPNHGFSHANNRGLHHVRRAVRAVPQPGHGDPRRHVRSSSSRQWTRDPDGRPGRRQAGDCRRRAVPDDQARPNAVRTLAEALGSERLPGPVALARRARARSSPLRDGGRVRLDVWLVHARPARGARERRVPRRAVLHLLPRRPISAYRIKQAGWEIRHLPTMTILHHAAEGRRQPEDGGAGCVRSAAVRAEELRARSPRRRTFGARPSPPLRAVYLGEKRAAASGGFAAGTARDDRPRPAAVRPAAARSVLGRPRSGSAGGTHARRATSHPARPAGARARRFCSIGHRCRSTGARSVRTCVASAA